MITAPMLAESVKNIGELEWPMIATPKVDGIRCLNPDGRILSRSWKPIPNHHIRGLLEKYLPIGADGELFSSNSFQQVTSDVMSRDGNPDFTYCMFDFVVDGDLAMPYSERLRYMAHWYNETSSETKTIIQILPFIVLWSPIELAKYEERMLEAGYEGVILRAPYGPYKCGRSTWKERYLLKLKVFMDSEAEVIGLEEQVANHNELCKNELGYAKRSAKKEGKVAAGVLGKFLARDVHTGVEFKCGTGQGLTLELRKRIWDKKKEYVGKIFKYKYQPHGVKNLPRIPIWLGFRDNADMS
jgi:DNA ligase-1